MTKKFLSLTILVRRALLLRGPHEEVKEKGTTVDLIIEKALRQLKSGVEEIAQKVDRNGISPQSLSQFERSLQGRLGEFARDIEKAVLEAADLEKTSIVIEGVRHYWKYKGPQEYQCLFGKIEVRRSVYQANGEKTVCPLEINAGILHHHLTPVAVEFISYAVAHMVPAELAEFCRRWQHLTPSETVIKQVAREVGEMAEMIQEDYEEAVRKEEVVPEETRVVTVSRDGTSVNIRNEGWRQAQVGAIACYGPLVKVEDDEEKERRERLRTVYVGQMPEEDTPSFNAKLDREVGHVLKELPTDCQIVCLADGALGIWNYFKTHPLLKEAVHINDFHHAADHLSDIANALFGEGTEKAETWFKKYRSILKKKAGGAVRVNRSIRYYRRIEGIRSPKRLEVIREGLRFFTRNRSRMKYAEYRRRGLPIGSGVVEAACKTLVGQRFKRAGMRWSIDGGQNILNLRSVVLSKRWDAFWKFHEQALCATRIVA